MWIPKLDRGRARPDAIVGAMRAAIEKGELVAHEKLPAQRDLAQALGVNLSTVARAFRAASQQNLIVGGPGRGSYVRPQSRAAALFARDEHGRGTIDLAALAPPEIDHTALGGLLSETCESDPSGLFRYPTPQLLARAEAAVVRWCEARRLPMRDREVVVCAGAQAALHVLLGLLVKRGEPVLAEAHTFTGLKSVTRFTGSRLVGVECDREGLIPEALAKACRTSGARTLVAVPNFQNPTGAIMGAERRARIAEVIEAQDITLIEDDIYGSFGPWPPLVSEIGGDHLVIGSLSKCVSPGLRFGYVVGSHPVVADLKSEAQMTSWMVAPVMMTLAAQLVSSGSAFTLADAQARILGERWSQVRRLFPEASEQPRTHLWFSVPDADAFCREAHGAGIRLVPSSYFAVEAGLGEFVRCSLTAVRSEFELAEGLRYLAEKGAVLR